MDQKPKYGPFLRRLIRLDRELSLRRADRGAWDEPGSGFDIRPQRHHSKRILRIKTQRNVEGNQTMSKIPCFLCTQELSQRKDKNRKPYFICDSCGVQIFVRGRQGIKNLDQLLVTLREHDFPFREHAALLYEIQALLTEIRGIKEEISKLDSLLEVFTSDAHKKRARKLLNKRIETLLRRLQQIADDKA